MAQRSIYREILRNFLNSLKPRKYWGNLVGKDYFGTEYYEVPLTSHGSRSRPSRWFVPVEKNNFTQEIPPEWEAWLRHRRKEPPTEEEIQLNLLKMQKTLENAAKLEAARTGEKDEMKTSEKLPFPSYEEYETNPGSKNNKK